MFQYALGMRLAYSNAVPFKLDISALENDPLRKFELDHFAIGADLATADEVKFCTATNRRNSRFSRLLAGLRPVHKQRVIRERSFNFDPKILLAGPVAYLEGYWQSEKYFKGFEEIIRSEFVFNSEPDSSNKDLGNAILSSNAVSMHVRRGDYVSNAATNQFHGVCSIEYYRKAVEFIAHKYPAPHFYIFSDDPDWVRLHISLDYPVTYVDKNTGEKSFEDMRLMSLCKHHIIANSTFSWWGAWLCMNPEKTIIAPERWFNKADIDTADLIPANWKRLSDRHERLA